MSRLTAIAILAIVTFLTIGAAVALADVVTPDDSVNGGQGDGTWTCPVVNGGDVDEMRQYHEAIHGEGSWDNMPGPGATTEEMQQYHEQVHGEGSWDNMPGPGATTEEMQQHHEQVHGEGSWDNMPGGNTGGTAGTPGSMMGW